MSDAIAKGDPAASAPSLACFTVDKGPSRCYDDAEALRAAELAPTASTARKRGSKGPIARKADCSIWAILWTWNGSLGNGAATSWDETGRWANFGAAINDEVSSYAMGDRAGHFAENTGGGGYWYPGNTSYCYVEDNINRYLPAWNNRFSSRYRVP